MPTNYRLVDDDRDFIAQALRHAAERYEQDARTMESCGQPALSSQFLSQCEQAKSLANAIDCGAHFVGNKGYR